MKTFLLLTLISFFGIFAAGQKKIEKAPLKLFFEVDETKFCFGNAVNITAKLRNVSKKPMVVDLNKIGHIKGFDIDSTNQGMLTGAPIAVGRHYKANFRILQPNESYIKDLKFVFDGEFFKNGRRYSMYIGYEQNRPEKFENIEAWKGIIFSNEVKILMKKCN
jgi:hypothetical protein